MEKIIQKKVYIYSLRKIMEKGCWEKKCIYCPFSFFFFLRKKCLEKHNIFSKKKKVWNKDSENSCFRVFFFGKKNLI